MRQFITALLFALSFAGTANASGNKLVAECDSESGQGKAQIRCELRFAVPAEVSQATITANGSNLQLINGSKYIDDSSRKSAWLFLIDHSNPARAKTVKANIDFVRSIIEKAGNPHRIGVAIFDSDLEIIVPIGSNDAEMEAKLASIKAEGRATELYSSALAAIKDHLASFDADRKALVIMSDGKAEDTAYSHTDVVHAARQAGVVIYGMGYPERASDTPHIQILQRLAEDTDGPFAETAAGSNEIDPAFAGNFFAYLENGGMFETKPVELFGSQQISLETILENGGVLKHQQIMKFADAPEPEPVPENEPSTAPEPISTPVEPALDGPFALLEPYMPELARWASKNEIVAWAGIAGLLLLLLVLIGFCKIVKGLFGRSSRADMQQPVQMEPRAPVYGWLEMVSDRSQRHVIDRNSTRIGKQQDNDICIQDQYVSRQHALLEIKEGRAFIHDLDSLNHVYLNGQAVTSSEVRDGDNIAFGKVEFRFIFP